MAENAISERPEMKAEKPQRLVLHGDMRKNLQITAFLIPKLYYCTTSQLESFLPAMLPSGFI